MDTVSISPDATDRANRRASALARIAELESLSIRHMRDMLLGSLSARPRLQAIADEIAKLSIDLLDNGESNG
jgi:hypothetical protein